MAAVLRVKRKNVDTPASTLVIACKRLKTECQAEDEDAPDVQAVVQFAGTLTDPSEDVSKILPKVLDIGKCKTAVKRTSDNCDTNVSKKVPKWIGVDSVVEKYKVIKYTDPSNEENSSEEKWMTLIDVKDTWSAKYKEDTEDYVYDLYYTPIDTFNDVWFENNQIFVQQPECSFLVCSDTETEVDCVDSDSNSESNWKNDYPDEDSNSDSSYDDPDISLHGDTSSSSDNDRLVNYLSARFKRSLNYHWSDDSDCRVAESNPHSNSSSEDSSDE